MLKKLTWKDGSVFSVKLRPSLFTLAQMRSGSCMQFFDVRSDSGDWRGIDLNAEMPLFCIIVAENRLKPLFDELVPSSKVISNIRPTPQQMINYRFGKEGAHSADLVELNERFSSVGAKVIKHDLTIDADLDIIYGHEYVGMVGDPEKLRKRLIVFFDTGVNWDESKAFIFKGIKPPPPSNRSGSL